MEKPVNSLKPLRESEFVLFEFYKNHIINKNERVKFQETFDDISNCIKQCFPNVIVCLYGSHVDGLAIKDSDLDITILFRNEKKFTISPKSIKLKFGELYLYLNSSQKYLKLSFIDQTKIPIIKIKTKNGVNVDISINNFNALRNTRLLKAYSDMNPRVIVLGRLLKQFVKLNKIGNVHEGTLPPYGYMLMLIHYLQKKNRLSGLHEDIDYDADPNLFKCNEMYPNKKIIKTCRHFKKLKIPKLWIGFFKYYTNEFQVKKYAVSNTNASVSKSEKFRPFVLSIKDDLTGKLELDIVYRDDQQKIVVNNDPSDGLVNVAFHLNVANFEKILNSFCDVLLQNDKIDPILSETNKTPKKTRRRSKKPTINNIRQDIYHKSLIPDESLLESKQTFQYFNICLFGSHVTGLANRNSDLDISILTDDNQFVKIQTANNKTINEKLEDIYDYLQSMKTIHQIEFIFDARVPIVTFKTRNNISGDISANNIDGIDKTLLIRQYCDFNSKILILGKLVKHFIEIYDIADASKGTMTSLAYIVMLIHFLQKKYNLQVLNIERHLTNPLGSIFAKNTWPAQSLPKLKESWKSKNQMPSIDILWIEFFKYYTIEFDYKKEVVNISIKEKMYKSTKGWQDKFLAIEDPILPSINFGANLDEKNYQKIKDAFTDVLLKKGEIRKCFLKTV